ncbi:MAG: threonine ammonia-lyase IlvA [Bacteroidota bacterium]
MTVQPVPGFKPDVKDVALAAIRLKDVVRETPLEPHFGSSERYAANVLLKREDLQAVRSYKIRGAYNKINSLNKCQLSKGIVCASAGNHAQGVALSCQRLGINGQIFMPSPTPSQKVKKVKWFGRSFVDISLIGDTFDDAYNAALDYSKTHNATFIHPFNDEKIIEGQATVGLEILNQANYPIDYLFLPVGGGGLAAGVSTVFKSLSRSTRIIGVEPEGAPAMVRAFQAGHLVTLDHIDAFADGAAVRRVGDLTFTLCQKNLDAIVTVPEGKICEVILQLYHEDAIVTEPAGALALGALDQFRKEIKGKNVVCLLSGGNNDISRMPEVKERLLLYKNLKHYFIVKFPQRAGALKEFVTEVLGPDDDIVHFEYTKKTSRTQGPAMVGIELKTPSDFEPLLTRMKDLQFFGEYLNDKPHFFQYMI